MAINNLTTVIGLLNGMIGGTILILPLLGMKTGYLMIALVCIFMGFLSGYTAYLIILHLGKSRNIKEAVLQHFKGDFKYTVIYNTFIGISFMPCLIAYFRLLCLQLEGLFAPSPFIPIIVSVELIILIIILKKYHLGERLLAYGIISIIAYIVFITWAQITTPSGPNTIKPIE